MAPMTSSEIAENVRRARAELDDEAIAGLVFEMTSIPSPSGEERSLAESVVERMAAAGIEARVQPVAGDQANAIGRLPGDGDGPSVMLYAPLDTAFSGVAEEDRPFLGDDPRPDFRLPPRREGPLVIGLGAENPKGYAAAAVAALEAIARVAPQLRGELRVALASGSMPIDRRPGMDRSPIGFGTGIRHLLSEGPAPDFAVVLKPGYAVAHAEVGLAWFRIVVRGAVNYTGIRHKAPYRNPVLVATRIAASLEEWFGAYAERNADESVLPQGSVNAIGAGSSEQVSYVPATCRIDFDVRLAPDVHPDVVEDELRALVERIVAEHEGFEVALERRFALPGTRTDPASAVVQSLIRAWEEREQREHAAPSRTSGASDAAIIREAGIATARIGLPPPSHPSPYSGFSMGVVDVGSVRRLAEVLIHAMLDLATRGREEVGLS